MAKNKGFFTFLLAFLAGFAVLMGCTGEGAGGSERGVNDVNEGKEVDLEPGTFPGLDAKTERRIEQDRGGSSHILRYLGTYNGYVVIQFPYFAITVVWYEEIDGIGFEDASPPGITVWKDGVFYTMTDLYERGLLTREDLLTIYDIHKELKEAYFGKNKQ